MIEFIYRISLIINVELVPPNPNEFEVEESVITPEAPIKETLELDSLSLVDLVALIESNFGIKIAGSEVSNIKTFASLYDFVFDRMK